MGFHLPGMRVFVQPILYGHGFHTMNKFFSPKKFRARIASERRSLGRSTYKHPPFFVSSGCLPLSEVDGRRRLIVQGLMTPLVMVKPKVVSKIRYRLGHLLVVVEINFFVLHASPQPLHKNILHRPAQIGRPSCSESV